MQVIASLSLTKWTPIRWLRPRASVRSAESVVEEPADRPGPRGIMCVPWKVSRPANEFAEEGTVIEPTTHTLNVPGAVLTYDVRSSESGSEPILLLIGSPMGAAGFGTLSQHFTDRTLVTYGPRGVERSTRTDG